MNKKKHAKKNIKNTPKTNNLNASYKFSEVQQKQDNRKEEKKINRLNY